MKFALAFNFVFACFVPSLGHSKEPPRRAKPPVWSRDVLDAFFDDAREHLVGERPASANTTNTQLASKNAAGEQPATGGFAWSQRISAETVTQEIKRVANTLRTPLANPSRFKSGGFQE
ncbi:MAG: hypothetical protein RID07_04780, partial [Lacipirellulaceae bacterium]